MGADSKIEWTEHTFNPWWGCVKVSPGCQHCYAETFSKRTGNLVWGSSAPRFFGDKHWQEPLQWNAEAEKAGKPARVFCASMADVFEDREDLDAPRQRLMELIDATPWLRWLLLTKRPQNITRLMERITNGNFGRAFNFRDHMPNVWLGTTVEDQKRADERIPALLAIEAKVRFLSCEPLLERVSLMQWLPLQFVKRQDRLPAGEPGPRGDGFGPWYDVGWKARESSPFDMPCGIHWVICGGESGPGARRMFRGWAGDLRDQCKHAGVPFLFKQWGNFDASGDRVGKGKAGRELDGRIHDAFPIL